MKYTKNLLKTNSAEATKARSAWIWSISDVCECVYVVFVYVSRFQFLLHFERIEHIDDCIPNWIITQKPQQLYEATQNNISNNNNYGQTTRVAATEGREGEEEKKIQFYVRRNQFCNFILLEASSHNCAENKYELLSIRLIEYNVEKKNTESQVQWEMTTYTHIHSKSPLRTGQKRPRSIQSI